VLRFAAGGKGNAPRGIVPQRLMDLGFQLRYDFRTSLQDWDKTNAEILKS
jgi:hypothetical protein